MKTQAIVVFFIALGYPLPGLCNDIYSGQYNPFESIYSGSPLAPQEGSPTLSTTFFRTITVQPYYWKIDVQGDEGSQMVLQEFSEEIIHESGTIREWEGGVIAEDYNLERVSRESGATIDRTSETTIQGDMLQVTSTIRRERETTAGF